MSRRSVILVAIALVAGALPLHAQSPVDVQVNLQQNLGPFNPVYAWFGYDESGYTTTPAGQALLHELRGVTPAPIYARAHFLLTSGNGQPELKWSSSNVYTEDATGKPVYDWTILDGIFDGWVHNGIRPMVELGFMPEALSTHPTPYHIPWPTKPGETEGWSWPPRDFAKWGDLVRHVAAHMLARYGAAEVSTWYWEVWNEPDIFYWRGTRQQYFQLYDYTVAGVRAAIPTARVGGPATTGPNPGSKSAAFLQAFLEHCAHDRSGATRGPIPLDFISFHVKGSPHIVDGHLQMGLNRELENAATGFDIVHASKKFRHLPVILSEADPEGCGACSPQQHPEDAYRNGTIYPAYTAAAMQALLALAKRDDVHLAGFVTWAFEFEGQPIFAGQRDLQTHGIDKPELNFFRIAGLLSGNRVAATSSAAVPLDTILANGVRPGKDFDALATREGNTTAVMLWNYQDDAVPGADTAVQVALRGIPANASRVLVEQYRIDTDHSNAFTAWQAMGSPQQPTIQQLSQLQAAGQLQLEASPAWIAVHNAHIRILLAMPPESIGLLRITWTEAAIHPNR